MIYKRKISKYIKIYLFIFISLVINLDSYFCMSNEEISSLREEVKSLFYHGYDSYMKYAFPADELMPLSCKGRYRDSEPNRGDIDDVLGNFTLTLIDTMDTLVIMSNLSEFEKSVNNVIKHVNFESDIVVSVFETNIRVVGGLLSAHILANLIKQKYSQYLKSYNNELLELAKDVAFRLLAAFDTATGIPYPRVNLKYGMDSAKIQNVKGTCTACAGTMILEFAALSRLTNISIFEEKARKAMDYLWRQRHRSSDLVGSVLNIHNGDWIRRESGVGAGIDSYYEYLLKAYILLGDKTYLRRFNRHYEGIMKYISQGPLLVDVHMHRPRTNAKNFMDSLLAFWPGLQVLKGDLIPAIKTHEILYQVSQQHNYLLPEAFNINDFQPYWAQFLIRPEFLESTYFLYEATNDSHYLEVGKKVLNAMKKFTKCKCGFATVRDVRTGTQDDRMDSFVLSETLKYLYLLFSKKEELIIDLNKFIFTTEAHFLPLYLSSIRNKTEKESSHVEELSLEANKLFTCPNINAHFNKKSLNEFFGFINLSSKKSPSKNKVNYYQCVRNGLKNYINYANYDKMKFDDFNVQTFRNFDLYDYSNTCLSNKETYKKIDDSKLQLNIHLRLEPENFVVYNPHHIELLKKMGIKTMIMEDGRVKLIHLMSSAETIPDGEEGVLFMRKLVQITKNQDYHNSLVVVKYKHSRSSKEIKLSAITAQFGVDLSIPNRFEFSGQLSIIKPFHACNQTDMFDNNVVGKFVLVERGDCMFIHKARTVERMGAIGCIVLDNVKDSSIDVSPFFAMSGDSNNDVKIPVVFLYNKQGEILVKDFIENPKLTVYITNIINEEKEETLTEQIQKSIFENEDKSSKVDKNLIQDDYINKEEVSQVGNDLNKSEYIKEQNDIDIKTEEKNDDIKINIKDIEKVFKILLDHKNKLIENNFKSKSNEDVISESKLDKIEKSEDLLKENKLNKLELDEELNEIKLDVIKNLLTENKLDKTELNKSKLFQDKKKLLVKEINDKLHLIINEISNLNTDLRKTEVPMRIFKLFYKILIESGILELDENDENKNIIKNLTKDLDKLALIFNKFKDKDIV